jgi:NSS family neurotransmitter:Na+ symporter
VTTQENTQHTQWSSRSAFLMATIGAAVGLGNLWRFPYIAGENGGGAFVLVYLACLVLVAIPIVVAEMTIGRMGQRSPVNTISRLIPKHRSRL